MGRSAAMGGPNTDTRSDRMGWARLLSPQIIHWGWWGQGQAQVGRRKPSSLDMSLGRCGHEAGLGAVWPQQREGGPGRVLTAMSLSGR